MEEDSFYNTEKTSRRDLRLQRESKKKRGGILEFVVILLISLVLVFGVVRPFIVEAYSIPSGSMIPTLQVGDRVLANKFIYEFTEPDRGDIAVFQSVEPSEDQILIKRVIGLPGDTIAVRNGTVLVNGEPQKEPYVNEKIPDTSFFGPERVPKGEYFLMGDNRARSQDSRFFGTVPRDKVEGEAFLRFWPPGRIGLL